MSIENNEPNGSIDTSDDLDLFSAELFGQSSPEPEPANSVEDEVHVEDDAPTNEDTHAEDDTPAEIDEEVKEAPKPRRNRFQERIDELTGKARDAERREETLRQELEALKSQTTKSTETKSTKYTLENGEPDPAAVDEDGNDVYPLGDLDPKYFRDVIRYEQERHDQRTQERVEQERQQAEISQARQALQTEWNAKLAPAQERYPDFQDKGEELIASLDIKPEYSEYLSQRIMELDNGPDVLYYLATHPDEAHDIVNSGATRATIALGRLDAKLSPEPTETRRVSKAPTPPPANKGNTAAFVEVPDDTDDLDAFAKKFFKKRG